MHELKALLTDVQTALAALPHREPEEAFNIFRLLRKETDEVNLHSRFLAELLNPKGSHGMGDAYLRLFLEQCEFTPAAFHVPTARVTRERDRIDILIRNDLQAIIIENKIWAGDQDRQLERYARKVSGWGLKWQILYLTLAGDPPSDQSIGRLRLLSENNEWLSCISYRIHIQDWLNACLEKVTAMPALRETLLQYLQLVKQLTGDTMSEAQKQEVFKFLQGGQNILDAHKIAASWEHVRVQTERLFWEELRRLINTDQPGQDVTNDYLFNEDLIKAALPGKRKRNPDVWYGIALPMQRLFKGKAKVYFMISRNDGSLFYGLRISGSETAIKPISRYIKIKTADLHLRTGPEADWPVWDFFEQEEQGIDFGSFSNEVTLKLANPTERARIVNCLWEEAKNFRKKVEEAIPPLE